MWARIRSMWAFIIPSNFFKRFLPSTRWSHNTHAWRTFFSPVLHWVRSFIFVMLLLLIINCKDIVFNNPLDPNASKDVVNVIRVIDTLLSGTGDMAFDGEKLWKINPYGNLTALDRESGTIIRSFYGVPGSGVVFLQSSIYLCNGTGENLLLKIDPLSGDTVNRISTRDLYPGYLASDGNGLFLFDVRSAGIFEYNLDSGEAIRLFAVPGINIGGMVFYKGGLLVSDMNTDTLYHFALSGAVLGVFSSPAANIGGLAADNSDYIYLFTLDGRIYKVSLP